MRVRKLSIQVSTYLTIALIAAPSSAELRGGIYQATVTTTGSDTRFRADGIERAFREVLVKASGNPRLLSDPRVDAFRGHAADYVAYFSYRDEMEGIHHHDDQGTYDRPYALTVQFDWIAINAALARLGENPWLEPRPVLEPIIAVRGHQRPFDQSYSLTEDEPRAKEQVASLAHLAQKYGVELRVPSNADLQSLEQTASDTSRKLVVRGTIDFKLDTSGWVAEWSTHWQSKERRWGVAGVSFDKAFENLVAGSVLIASGHEALK